MRVAVLISGRGSNMKALAQGAAGYEVVLVASNNPLAPGLAWARDQAIPTWAWDSRKIPKASWEEALDRSLEDHCVGTIALAGFMRILSPEFTRKWSGRIVNIHPSLLPKYKGLHTHARALAAGDTEAGCTVHVVTEGLDDGPVLGQLRVAILPGDDEAKLAARVLVAEHQLYSRTLAAFVSQPFDAAFLREKVRALALALPETEDRPSHGSPGWKVAGKSGKYFAYFSERHHGEEHIALLVKTSGPDELAALVERDPEGYYRPAYYGASGWVGIILDRPGVDWDSVAAWLERSWRSVAPARLTRMMQAAEEF